MPIPFKGRVTVYLGDADPVEEWRCDAATTYGSRCLRRGLFTAKVGDRFRYPALLCQQHVRGSNVTGAVYNPFAVHP
jgi:hypothetical protein